METARAMQGEGLFRSLQLRAKSKMCANTEMVCHEEFCPWAAEYGLKLVRTGLSTPARERPHQDPDEIYRQRRATTRSAPSRSARPAARGRRCGLRLQLRLRPGLGLGALLGGGALRDAVLVIDEAHNLVDRSREYYSPALDRGRLDAPATS